MNDSLNENKVYIFGMWGYNDCYVFNDTNKNWDKIENIPTDYLQTALNKHGCAVFELCDVNLNNKKSK